MADNLDKKRENLDAIHAKIDAIEQDESSYDQRYKDRAKFKVKVEKELLGLREKRIELEKDIIKTSTQQVKNAKTYKKLEDNVLKTEQNISKTITSRVGDLLRGNVQSALSFSNTLKASKAQITLAKDTRDVAKRVSGIAREKELSVEQEGKLLDISTDIRDGVATELDIENRLTAAGIEKGEVYDDLSGTFTDLVEVKETEEDATEKLRKQEERINQVRTIGLGIFGLLATVAKKFAGMVDAIGQQFGSLNMMGKDFQTNLHDSTVEATKLGLSQADVLNTTSALASEYGISLDKAAELSVKILDTAKATGLSVDESTKLYGTLMQVVDLTKEEAENLIESTAQLARQRGVAPQAVLKDIANSSEVIATFTKGAGENLFEAAIAARELGLNVDTIAKSARGMLDLESSLNAEYEASALLGKQINLQKARELAFSKDLPGFSKELKNQLRGVGDFTKLNIFQQEAIAKAIGMSVGETSKLLSKTKEQEDATKKLTLAGALAAGSFDDLHGQEALSNLSKVVNKFKAFIQQALITVGPILEGIIGKFHDWFMTMGGINKVLEGMKTLRTWIGEISVKVTEFFDQGKGWDEMKEKLFGVDGALHGVSVAFEAIGGAIKLIARNIPEVIGLMVSLKAVSFAAFLVQSALAAAGGAAAHPWLLGGGAVIAAAAILGVVSSINAMRPPPTPTADFKSGPGGISYMSGPAGAFSLNPRDSVLATTNPIPVNDIQTGAAGSMMPDFKELVEAQRETTRAISNMRLSTTVTNRQQETIMEGAFNQLGGTPLLGGGRPWA
tara:strand:- start:8088 stop:10460 length:2373 start_codon:yes stop_codon:yes gene_type:complete